MGIMDFSSGMAGKSSVLDIRREVNDTAMYKSGRLTFQKSTNWNMKVTWVLT